MTDAKHPRAAGQTSIAHVDIHGVSVHGKDLSEALIGKTGFTAYFLFLLTGREPDAKLVAITDAADALRTVVALGHATCVASSTSLAGLRRNLERTGLLELVDPHVFSASQVKRGKPAPDVFLYAASQMGVDPAECLVIEDSVAGTTAARRAGMDVVGFTGGSHVDDELADRLLAAGARRIFTSQGQLVRWLHNGGGLAPGNAGVSPAS